MVETQETYVIDFTKNGVDEHITIIGTYSNVKMIYSLITGRNKSLWLENEYGTHPIHVNIEE